MWCICRRRPSWSTKCSTWQASRRRTTSSTLDRATGASSSPQRSAARALGIEYDGPLVELSKRNAASERVSDKATFVQADLFESDFSQATVLTMFLLSDIMLKLRPKIVGLKPGTRVVSNSFEMDGWAPDDSARIPDCKTWCTAHLWIVPARVEGTWRLPQGSSR